VRPLPIGSCIATRRPLLGCLLADLIFDPAIPSVYGEAGNATSWLAIPSLARLVCGSGFSTRHLLYGKLDVFINLPLKVISIL
jgi:hypothetical protein